MLANRISLTSAFLFACLFMLAQVGLAEDVIRWRKDLEEAKQEAAQSGRLVLLHFYGSSCPPCAKLDKEVFSQKKTADALEANYVPVKINVDHSMAIASAFNVTSWPTDVVITANGQIVAKFISPQGLSPYLTRMDQVAVTARDQAAAGLVRMGANGTNPYSHIATSAVGAAAATNQPAEGYAAPTQYQEAASGAAGPVYVPQANVPANGSPYVQPNGVRYGSAPGQDPYAGMHDPTSTQNIAAPSQPTAQNFGGDRYGNAVGDRYGNPAAGDRYATPSFGGYDSTPPAYDRYAVPPMSDPSVAPTQSTANYGAFPGHSPGGAAPDFANSNQDAPGAYAPPPGPQSQQNPYAAAPQDRYSSYPGQASNAPPAQSGYDPNYRYDTAPPSNSTGMAAPQADNRYATAPPNGSNRSPYDDYQQAAPQQPGLQQPPVGYNPAIDYSQAPAMNGGPASPTNTAAASNSVSQPPSGGANAPGYAAGAPAAQERPQTQPTSGNPAFGLDGFCPVSLAEKQRWIQGDKAWGAIHLGKTYLFTSQESQQKFLASPDQYAPVLSGHDPVLVLERNLQLPGNRSHGVFYRDRVYLFSSEETLAAFGKDPERYANGVRQAMQQGGAGSQQRR